MEIIGYIAATIIGLTLGLIGGGGSILTVPVLVYLLDMDPVTATAYSLFIVGLSSLVGSYKFYRKGLVSLKTAAVFGLPSILAVYATRRYIVPAIPEQVFSLGEVAISRGMLMMLLFAALMIFASISMIRKKKPASDPTQELVGDPGDPEPQRFHYAGILGEGLLVGTLTGLVGAGGGFLIIPALVLFSGLDMKLAVGTSLLIIAAKSLIGFTGDMAHLEIDWVFLSVFSALSIGGIFVGSSVAAKVPANKLETAFGWFVLVMGIYIMIAELFL